MSNLVDIRLKSPDQKLSQLVLYFVFAYGFSVVLWLPMMMGKSRSRFSLSIGTFGPTLAAFTTHWIFARNWRAVRVWSTLPSLLLGIVSGVLVVLSADFFAAFLMTQSGFDRWQWASLVQILTLFGPNLWGGPLGEESGWRGYALPRLQRRLNPLVSSLFLGFLWANWHLPLIFAHVYNVTWWQFVLMTMSASIFLSFGFNKSGGSTLCAVIVHGFYNIGFGIIFNDFIGKATLRSNMVQQNTIWITYVGVAILLCILTKGQLGYRSDVVLQESHPS